jgi:hypothetical protein
VSQILVIYSSEPPFPASDQHPEAARYKVGDVFVDALDGEPSEDEVTEMLAAPYKNRAKVLIDELDQSSDAELDAWIDQRDPRAALKALMALLMARRII